MMAAANANGTEFRNEALKKFRNDTLDVALA